MCQEVTTENNFRKVFEILKENVFIKRIKVGSSHGKFTYQDVFGKTYRVASNYQPESKILYQLLLNRFSWFETFTKTTNKDFKNFSIFFESLTEIPKELRNITLEQMFHIKHSGEVIKVNEPLFKVYTIENDNSDIYIETELGQSANISLKGLLTNNINLINEHILNGIKNTFDCTTDKSICVTFEQIINTKEVKQLFNCLKFV